ncbi:Benzoate 4-monooxygenase cytochrome P450 [Rasamsonia emersonii CBS 393.64]|uniref:Benzoate 4-monooxygenase cytochrome P450 n=1 Tax=Rasamsonia emersonii (strain ATCC 16479 / CBS 393.64 / IMI 116815) TaxID=1408163 RepID=A0A0F4Z227_RASE3|nr:Benzoate 4-monooxygenase cytochrome P450 [Rasamsonia emersonii CBS 393.64]KKA24572.1 Benzoate 4-monooxygenase cytochrome P450 [Rasamsonia emersonii CBS 393.64]
MLTIQLLATVSITAVLLHHVFFKRVEVDRRPVSLAAIFVAAYFATAAALWRVRDDDEGLVCVLACAGLIWSCFVVSLWTSMLVYRAFFHPLHKFPGPFGAKLSKLWTLRKVVQSKLRWYQVLDELHEKYGDYVRTGPRELVIFDSAAITPILGFASVTKKGPFYDSMETSVNTTRDREFHRKRRKIWDNAFKQSLADYGPRIEGFTDDLLVRIGKNLGKPIVVNEICIHYSYDVMSALAFGNPMGFIKGDSNEIANSILSNIQRGVDAIGLLLHVPWLMTTLTTFSWAIGPMRQWNLYSQELVMLRKARHNRHSPNIPLHPPRPIPRMAAKTARGNRPLARDVVQLRLHALVPRARRPHQRVYAAAPVCVFRLAARNASGGDDDWRGIHPREYDCVDTVVSDWEGEREITDMYVSDERNFVRAKEFLPERWLSKPELILNRHAHMPFLTGPYSCAGRNLAMMELRSVIARTVHAFDIAFPDGTAFDPEEYFSRVKDHFVAGAPAQELLFTRRSDRMAD